MSPLDRARAAWGDPLPDWIAVLARECAATSQNRTAERLGYSAAVVSQVLARKYRGDMARVEDMVRGVWMAALVECPVLGPIPTHSCRQHRDNARHFAGHNAQRVRMFRACNRCPRHRQEDAE